MRNSNGCVAEAKACLQAAIGEPREAWHLPPFTGFSQTRDRSVGLVDSP